MSANTKTLNIAITADASLARAELRKTIAQIKGTFQSFGGFSAFGGLQSDISAIRSQITALKSDLASLGGTKASSGALEGVAAGVGRVNKELAATAQAVEKVKAVSSKASGRQQDAQVSAYKAEMGRAASVMNTSSAGPQGMYAEINARKQLVDLSNRGLAVELNSAQAIKMRFAWEEKIAAARERLAKLPGMNGNIVAGIGDEAVLKRLATYEQRLESIRQKQAKLSQDTKGWQFSPYKATNIQQDAHIQAFQKSQSAALPFNISQEQLQRAGASTKQLDQYAASLGKLQRAISSQGLDKVQAFIKDINSGRTFKGQAGEVAQFINSKDIAVLKEGHGLFQQVGSAIDATGAKITDAHTKVGGFMSSVKSMAAFQLQFYTGMAAIFTALAIVKNLFGAAIEFEQVLRNIQAASDLTNEETSALGKSFIQISKEVPIATEELAKLALQLTYAGVNSKDLAAAVEIAAKVALISGEDMKQVAFAIATVIQAWGYGADKMEEVGNIIAIGFNKSRLQVQDMGTAMNYLAGMMSNLNMPFKEVMATLATLSNLGVRASTLATGWRQFMADLLGPSKKLREHFKEMNVDISKINPANIQGPHMMVQILDTMERAGMTTASAFEYLQTRSASFYMFLKTAGRERLLAMEAEMDKADALNKAVATVKSGLKSEYIQLWNNLKAAVIDFLMAALPVFQLLAKIIGVVGSGVAGLGAAFNTPMGKVVALSAIVWGLVRAYEALVIAQKAAAMVSITKGLSSGIMAGMGGGTSIGTIAQIAIALKNAISNGGGFIAVIKNIIGLLGPWGKAISLVITAIGGGYLFDKIFGDKKSVSSMTNDLNKVQKKFGEVTDGIHGMGQEADETEQKVANSIKSITTNLNAWQVKKFGDYQEVNGKKEFVYAPEVKNLLQDFEPIFKANEELQKLEEQMEKVRAEQAKLGPEISDPGPWDLLVGYTRVVTNEFASLWRELKHGAEETFAAIKGWFAGLIDDLKQYDWDSTLGFGMKWSDVAEGWKIISGKGRQIKAEALKKQEEDLKASIERQKKIVMQSTSNIADGNKLQKAVEKMSYKLTDKEKLKQYWEEAAKILSTPPSGQKMTEGVLLSRMKGLFPELKAGEENLWKGYKQSHDIEQYIAGLNKKIAAEKAALSEEIETAKINKELRDERIKQEADAIKASIDAQNQYNEHFYSNGLSMAQSYYEKKEQLMREGAANEINQAKQLAESRLQFESDSIEKIREVQDSRWEDKAKLLGRLFSGGLSDKDLQATRNEIENIDKELSSLGKQAKTHELEATKTAGAYQLQKQKIQEQLQLQIAMLELKKKVDVATEPYKLEAERLGVQRDYVSLLKEAYELSGNWTAAEAQNVELAKIQRDLNQANLDIQIKKAEVETATLAERILIARLDGEDTQLDQMKLDYAEKILDILRQRKTIQGQIDEKKVKNAADPLGAEFEALENQWKNYDKQVRDLQVNLYKDSAQAFSDIFYDGITGKLKSIGDYFKNIFGSILKMFTDMLGRMIAMNLKQAIFGGGGMSGIEASQLGFQGPTMANGGYSTGGTGLFGGGGFSGISGILGSAGIGLGVSSMLGNGGKGSMIGGGLGGIAGGVLLTGVGTSGMGLIGGGLTSLLTGGGASALSGAIAGSVVPIIGTLIGAIAGTLLGGLFGGKKDLPEMLLSYSSKKRQDINDPALLPGSEYGHTGLGYSEEGPWKKYTTEGTTGGVYTFAHQELGINEVAMLGIAKSFAAVGDAVKGQLTKFGLDISGFAKDFVFHLGDIEGLSEEQIQAKIKEQVDAFLKQGVGDDLSKKVEQFKKSGESFADTLGRILTALETAPKVSQSIGTTIKVIKGAYGPSQALADQRMASDENMKAIRKALSEATDPSDIIKYTNDLKQAIFERYQMEVQFVRDLQSAIDTLAETIKQIDAQIDQINVNIRAGRRQWADRDIGIQGKIDGLLGQHNVSGLIEKYAPGLADQYFNQSKTPEEKTSILDTGMSWVDQWLADKTGAIKDKYAKMEKEANERAQAAAEAQKEALAKQIEVLNKEKELLDGWKSLLEAVKQTIYDLSTSSSNPDDIRARYHIAKSEADRVQGLYMGATGEEKLKYGQDLHEKIKSYLSLGQEAFQRPSAEYLSVYEEAMKTLEMLKADAEAQVSPEAKLLEDIKRLQEASNSIQAQQVSYSAAMDAEIQALNKEAAGYYEWYRGEYTKQLVAQEIIQAAEKKDLEDKRVKAEADKKKLEAELKGVIGDKSLEAYIAEKQGAAVSELQALNKQFTDFLNTFKTAIGVTTPTATVEASPIEAGGGSSSVAGGVVRQPSSSRTYHISIDARGATDPEAIRRVVTDAVKYDPDTREAIVKVRR